MANDTKILIVIILGTLVIIGGGVFFLSRSSPPSLSSQPVADPSLLVRDDSQKLATESATITLVEFADFQCPACAVAYPFVKRILGEYPTDISYVYRNFPLSIHAHALSAALAAEAAGNQGKFFAMHDTLYDSQSDWSDATPDTYFEQYAREIGLDVETWRKDINDSSLKEKILRDQRDGFSLGVDATPTFFLNGRKLSGFSYEELRQAIEDLRVPSPTASPSG